MVNSNVFCTQILITHTKSIVYEGACDEVQFRTGFQKTFFSSFGQIRQLEVNGCFKNPTHRRGMKTQKQTHSWKQSKCITKQLLLNLAHNYALRRIGISTDRESVEEADFSGNLNWKLFGHKLNESSNILSGHKCDRCDILKAAQTLFWPIDSKTIAYIWHFVQYMNMGGSWLLKI